MPKQEPLVRALLPEHCFVLAGKLGHAAVELHHGVDGEGEQAHHEVVLGEVMNLRQLVVDV